MKIIEIAHAGVISESPRLVEVALNILEFLLRIFGMIAIIGLVVSGIIYLTASGNEDRLNFAKKSLTYSIVGIIVGLGAIMIIRQIANIYQ